MLLSYLVMLIIDSDAGDYIICNIDYGYFSMSELLISVDRPFFKQIHKFIIVKKRVIF